MTMDSKTVGLAMSGGGFRATLFALGSLWRLNDAKILGRLDRMTSVSGGSIAMGILAHRWTLLEFIDGRATNFSNVIAAPIRKFCSQTIDISAGLWGKLTPFKTAGDFLADRYKKDLFGDAGIKSLPVADGNAPKFTFYATNMQTGRSFRFRQDMMADYMLGVSRMRDVPLAVAVAASSAFPPIFSPVILKTDPIDWSKGADLPNLETLRKRIVLADGGVYDNMGLEALIDNVDIALVSDAGAPFKVDETPFEDDLLQLGRVRDILIDQTRALRKRWFISELDAGRKRGAYWGIGTALRDYPAGPRMPANVTTSAALEMVPTRLKAFEPELQGHLINWGYALCDVALRTRVGWDLPLPSSWPIPEWPL